MKIEKLETFHVSPRWMFLTITTSDGTVGYGEPVVEGLARTTERAVHEFSEYLIGKDPRLIEHHWQAMYRGSFYRGGPVIMSAISGIEQALWDIKGKHYAAPVYELLGGAYRDSIRMYAHCMATDVDQAVSDARALVADGFTAIKMGLDGPVDPIPTPQYIEKETARFEAVRAAVGDNVDIAIDFHGRTTPDAALKLIARLEDVAPMFVEEPCLPEYPEAMVRIARSTSIPIATGERLFTRWQYRELLEKQAVSIVQPDLSHCGGIFEARKIAAAAEPHYIQVAPHNPLGPVSLAACLQLDACTPNAIIQEHPTLADGSDLGEGLLKNPFTIRDGRIQRPAGPGLGIELDMDLVRERAYDGAWKSPHFRYPDGAVADW